MNTGPDIPSVECYEPDGCCVIDPCLLDKQRFIVSIRALLPESEMFPILECDPVRPADPAGTGVGCFKVGCEQLIFGSCCGNEPTCWDYGQYPQLAIFDTYAAGLFDMVAAVCAMIKELSPCTAEYSVRQWAARFGLLPQGRCDTPLTDKQLKALACLIYSLGQDDRPWNAAKLQALAGMFGATVTFVAAGDFTTCNPFISWWTFARDSDICRGQDVKFQCDGTNIGASNLLDLSTACEGVGPVSINVIVGPAPIHIPGNCNRDVVDAAHDPELYEVFKTLLARVLPGSFCVYEQSETCEFVPVSLAPEGAIHGRFVS